MRLRPFVLGPLIYAGCAGVAAAQPAMPTVAGDRQFNVSTSVSAIYDSNFARSSSALAAQRGISRREYTLRPQVSVDIIQPLGGQALFLRGGAGYDLHRENSQLDRPRADLQGGYLTSLGFCQLAAFGAYRVSQSDLALIDSPAIKNTQQSTSIAAGATCGRPRGFGGSAIVQRSENMNSAAIQKEADSTTENLLLSLGYTNPTLGRLAGTFNYSNNEFPNRILPGRPVGDGFFTTAYGLSAERQFGSRITVRAAAGRTTVKREFAPPGSEAKFTSTTYSAAATYRAGSRLTFDVLGDRAVTPSPRAGKLYDIVTSGEVRGSYSLGSRYVVGFGHRIQDIDSNVDTTLNVPVLTNSRTNATFASLRYRQSRRASLLLDVRYEDRNANLPEFNYTSTRVGLTAEVGF
ncbi:hypothetical protein [Phenylobacterium sp.]|uniref:hypothetical protein n=1 Tax=Phenylobacterium sp. TaxID=1871053 RepID=UPI00301BAF38